VGRVVGLAVGELIEVVLRSEPSTVLLTRCAKFGIVGRDVGC
jgi:hypothetical protein